MDKTHGGGTLGYYVEDYPDKDSSITLIITAKSEVGQLAGILDIFKKYHVNLLHIESRPSKTAEGQYDFLLNADNMTGGLKEALTSIKNDVSDLQILARNQKDLEKGEVPWFPRKIKDLDRFANQILSYGSELDSDHPGFTDETYRKRRKQFADIAFFYKHGQLIPKVEYTEEEVATWRTVFDKLTKLYPSHACKEFNYIFPLLQQNCGYNRDNIPQLQEVSDFLKDCTGFTLRPVAGLLSSRDFLAGLAFRVFHSTQYIRHPKVPLYTPEPDVCHELLGHVPLFCNPDFAQFSQEIGLASLGASDEYIERLATCYWFTVEFGICKEGDLHKAYGAGLLSSFGELQYCLTNEPEMLAFEPEQTSLKKYPITQYQPTYFVAHSFSDAKNKLIAFSKTTNRPFAVKYDPYSQTVNVIDSGIQVKQVFSEIGYNLNILEDAVSKLIES